MGDNETMVLVVDDDEPTRRLFASALRREGFGVLEAADGEAALSLVADEEVSVVLLDGQMPGMDGLMVLKALRSMPTGRTLPVIFVTGQDEIDDRVRGLDAGADDYVTKPVDIHELVARVRAQLRGRDAWVSSIDALERRLNAITLLRRIRRGDSLESTVHAVCTELMHFDGIDGAAVLSFHGARVVVPLAVAGALHPLFAVREALSDFDASVVVRRSFAGPWVAPPGNLDEEAQGRESLFHATADTLVCAPLYGDKTPVGVLVLAAKPGHDFTGGLLSSAIDFATVVGALIAPELAHQGTLDAARAHLRSLTASESFVSYFQPVVELHTGDTVGYEALTRWNDGVRPDLRFAEAHALGIGVEIEFSTLAGHLQASTALPDVCWLGVNASPAMLASAELADLLANVQRPIVVEITEHDRIDDYEQLCNAADMLTNVRLAVDDAGAGYASMRHILDLHPDLVKLDISWTRDIDSDRARQALVAGMVSFAGELGCTLIAEGIESHAERDTLIQLGVSHGQGYLFAHPAPVGAFT